MVKKNGLVSIKDVVRYKGHLEEKYIEENKFKYVGVRNGLILIQTLDNENIYTVAKEEVRDENGKECEIETNPVMKTLELVDNEVDIRGLSSKDYKQLMWRCEVTKQGYLKSQGTTLLEIEMLLRAVCKKVGLDPEKVINEAFTPKESQ